MSSANSIIQDLEFSVEGVKLTSLYFSRVLKKCSNHMLNSCDYSLISVGFSDAADHAPLT